MPDRENVIGHLNDCIEASRRDNTWVFVRKDIVEDALTMLKEQEPIPAIDVARCGWRGDDCRYGKCPKCGKWIMSYHDYCGYCGQAVKWE